MKILIATLVLASCGISQMVTVVPLWASDYDNSEYVPSEYAGAYSERVGIQFRKNLHIEKGRHSKLRSTTVSGVAVLYDRRTTPASKIGWDTGYDRIHSIKRVVESGTVDRYLVSAFDSTNGQSQMLLLSVPAVGAITQSSVGPASGAAALWTAGTLLGDTVYFYDAQSHNIERLVDTDQNGTPDALDGLFSTLLPQDQGPGRSLFMVETFFLGIGGEVIVTDGARTYVTMYPVAGGYDFELNTRPPVQRLLLNGPVTDGQERVFVLGNPGIEFHIMKMDPANPTLPPVAVSSGWTIPQGGGCVVDLTSSLQAGEKVRPEAVSGVVEHPHWRSVKTVPGVVVFEPMTSQILDQDSDVVIFGDGLQPTHEFHYVHEGASGILKTKYLTGGSLSVRLPTPGSANASPPFNKYTTTRLWLVDRTSGETVSNTVSCTVRHD